MHLARHCFPFCIIDDLKDPREVTATAWQPRQVVLLQPRSAALTHGLPFDSFTTTRDSNEGSMQLTWTSWCTVASCCRALRMSARWRTMPAELHMSPVSSRRLASTHARADSGRISGALRPAQRHELHKCQALKKVHSPACDKGRRGACTSLTNASLQQKHDYSRKTPVRRTCMI